MTEARRRVLKWTVTVDDRVHEIGRGKVLHVANQYDLSDGISVWTLETDEPADRQVQAFGTGQPLPPEAGDHHGTVLAKGGALVWHLFEIEAPA